MTVHRQNSHNGLLYAGHSFLIAKGKASHMRFLDIQSDDVHVLALRLSLGILIPHCIPHSGVFQLVFAIL